MLTDAAAALQLAQQSRQQRRHHSNTTSNFVWYPESDHEDDSGGPLNLALHVRAHLPSEQEALLVDTGARKNLTGDAWVQRVKSIAERYGLEINYKSLKESMKVQGVGKHSQRVTEEMQHRDDWRTATPAGMKLQ